MRCIRSLLFRFKIWEGSHHVQVVSFAPLPLSWWGEDFHVWGKLGLGCCEIVHWERYNFQPDECSLCRCNAMLCLCVWKFKLANCNAGACWKFDKRKCLDQNWKKLYETLFPQLISISDYFARAWSKTVWVQSQELGVNLLRNLGQIHQVEHWNLIRILIFRWIWNISNEKNVPEREPVHSRAGRCTPYIFLLNIIS